MRQPRMRCAPTNRWHRSWHTPVRSCSVSSLLLSPHSQLGRSCHKWCTSQSLMPQLIGPMQFCLSCTVALVPSRSLRIRHASYCTLKGLKRPSDSTCNPKGEIEQETRDPQGGTGK